MNTTLLLSLIVLVLIIFIAGLITGVLLVRPRR